MAKTLIVGDVHGRLARLEALLLQEKIIEPNGLTRLDTDTRVIQLGDLIDCNPYRTSPSDDEMIVASADKWVDEFLWGNHERPIADGPTFGGYGPPTEATGTMLGKWRTEGRYHLATSAEGFLITHAGLSDQAFTGSWVDDDQLHRERTGSLKRHDVERLAAWINHKDPEREYVQKMFGGFGWDLRDNIGYDRGGDSYWGGIIWRDSREGLWSVPQVFGHSSHQVALEIPHGPENSLQSYCIDTSKHERISAIWLPERRVVTIDDTEDQDL